MSLCRSRTISISLALVAAAAAAPSAHAAFGDLSASQKISDTEGSFLGTLNDSDHFGISTTRLGDLDNDGTSEIAVGAYLDDEGGPNRGAVWVLFLQSDRTVKAEVKIAGSVGVYTLDDNDRFGSALAGVGDLNGDGVEDLVASAHGDDDGGTDRGAIYVILMRSDGTPLSARKVSSTHTLMAGLLDDGDVFGTGLAAIGDLDGDGISELAVGAPGDDDGSNGTGAVYILFLLPNGGIHHVQKISQTAGGLTTPFTNLDPASIFGSAIAGLGDISGDGLPDIAVGAPTDDDSSVLVSNDKGAVWIVRLDHDGTVKGRSKISEIAGGGPTLDDNDRFGLGVTALGDIDGDAVLDIAVGAYLDDDGGTNRGAFYVLLLNPDGSVKSTIKHSAATSVGTLDDDDRFGEALAGLGDFNGDGNASLVVSAYRDDDGGTNRGSVYIYELSTSSLGLDCGDGVFIPSAECEDGNTLDGDGCTGSCQDEYALGFYGAPSSAGTLSAVVSGSNPLSSVDFAEPIASIASAAASAINLDPTQPDPSVNAVAVGHTVLTTGVVTALSTSAPDLTPSRAPGTARGQLLIANGRGGFGATLALGEGFGTDAAALGDVDGDGIDDLAVSTSPQSFAIGTVWILLLNADGSVKSEQAIGSGLGGFTGTLAMGDQFGVALAGVGDLDSDGVPDLAVGASADSQLGSGRGAVWILFLNANGAVKSHQKINDAVGGFTGTLDNDDGFGEGIARLDDLDGDGVHELAVGAFGDGDGALGSGAVWVLFMNGDGTVASQQKISATSGGFGGALASLDGFGSTLASADLDGDGRFELAVAAPGDDGPSSDTGAVWLLSLTDTGSVASEQKIGASLGGFGGLLRAGDAIGSGALEFVGDLDHNGVRDLAVGAPSADGATRPGSGGVWIWLLEADGTVASHQLLDEARGGSIGPLINGDGFGEALAWFEAAAPASAGRLAVGAVRDDTGDFDTGAIWLLDIDGARAFCGDLIVVLPESCDDGNLISGDGCYASCEVEHSVTLLGTAQGGTVDITLDGVTLQVATSAGENAEQVAANLVAAINASLALQGRGISAIADGARVVTNRAIDALVLGDPGLLEIGMVVAEQKISDLAGGFTGGLVDADGFGASAALLGDVDHDGVDDVAVGADGDDDGGTDRGAVYILFMNANGTVKTQQKISATAGGFTGPLANGDRFGAAVAGLGDLDGDGVEDVAVGAPDTDGGGSDRGAVYTLFLNSDGSVKSHSVYQDGSYGIATFADGDRLGAALARVGDLDGDGSPELAVAMPGRDDGASNAGAVRTLFMLPDGNVAWWQTLSPSFGNLTTATQTLAADDEFGAGIAAPGDIDGDGVPDLAVGAQRHDLPGAIDSGALWILLLNDDATVKARRVLDANALPALQTDDRFGGGAAGLGDLDGNGVPDLAVGATRDDDGGSEKGAVYLLFLNTDGSIASSEKLSATQGGFGGALTDDDRFGGAVAGAGDLDGDGRPELVVGAPGDDDGGGDRGAVWLLSLETTPQACGDGVLDPGEACDDGGTLDFDGCTASCEIEDSLAFFGVPSSLGLVEASVAAASVASQVGIGDAPASVAATAASDWNADALLVSLGKSAVRLEHEVFTNATLINAGTSAVDHYTSFRPGAARGNEVDIADGIGGFVGPTPSGFATDVADIGDVDGDGISDLAVGSQIDTDGGTSRGAAWILLLNPDNTVKAEQKISDLSGGFAAGLSDFDFFGSSIGGVGDFDGDGVPDVAVGARGDGGNAVSGEGAVYLLFLNADGTVKSHQKIKPAALASRDQFGSAVALVGDADGDGVPDLAAGASGADDGGSDRGAVWILFMNANGTLKGQQRISQTAGNLGALLDDAGSFGAALATAGDLDQDGTPDVFVGAPTLGIAGAIFVVYLNPDGSVKQHRQIDGTHGGFGGYLQADGNFGRSIVALPDLNGDGVRDLAVGSPFADQLDLGNTGAIWVLYLGADGRVTGYQKVSGQHGLLGPVPAFANLGNGLTLLPGRAGAATIATGNNDRIKVFSLDGAVPFCGDTVLVTPEVCDDGNLTPGDGCYASCQLEDGFLLVGTAQGGQVDATISGELISVTTSAGEPAAQVIANLVAALNANPQLAALGISAVAIGNELVTDGTVDNLSITDPGLLTIAPGAPALPSVAWWLLAASLVGVAAAFVRRRPTASA